MIRIANNGFITIHRGDSFNYPIYINIGTNLNPKEYLLHEDDIIYFSICEPNKEFEQGIFRRKYTNKDFTYDHKCHVVLEPNDTKDLLPGVYYFEIRAKLFTGNIVTITPRKKFIILE